MESANRTTAVLSGFYLIWAYYAALGIRDIVVAFFILFTVLLVLRLPERKSLLLTVVDLVLIGGALAIVYWYRSFSCYALLAAIGGALILRPFGPKTRVILVTSGFVIVAYSLPLLIDRFELVRTFVDQADRWGAARAFRPSSTSLAQRLIYGAPWPLGVPVQAIYSLVMPVPPMKGFAWHEIVFGLGNSFWYFLVPFWAVGLTRTWRNFGTTLIGVATVVMFAGVAYVQPDVRHKIQYMGFAMIHAAVGWQALGSRRGPILAGLAGIYCVLGAVYLFLKAG